MHKRSLFSAEDVENQERSIVWSLLLHNFDDILLKICEKRDIIFNEYFILLTSVFQAKLYTCILLNIC